MILPNWSPLARHGAVHEFSREDAGSEDGGRTAAAERRRREDGIRDANSLSPQEALAAIRAIRAKSLSKLMPDSTPLIRADRDGR